MKKASSGKNWRLGVNALMLSVLVATGARAQVVDDVDGPFFDRDTKGDWRGKYGQCYAVVPYTPNTTRIPENKVGPGAASRNPNRYQVNGRDAQCVSGLPSFLGFVDFAVGTQGEPGGPGNEPAGEAFIWHYCDENDPTSAANCRDNVPATWRVKSGVSQFNACLTEANNGQPVFYNSVWDSEADEYEPMYLDLFIDRGGDARVAYYFVEGAGECRNLEYRLLINGVEKDSGTIAKFEDGLYMYFDLKNLRGASDVRLELKLAADGGAACATQGPNSLLGGAFIGGDVCGRVAINIRKGDPQSAQDGLDERTIPFGAPVSFGIVVKNTGEVALTNVKVTDAQVPGCAKDIGTLAPGQEFPYVCNAPNAAVSYVNEACVAGTGNGQTVTDCDPSKIVVPPLCGLSVDKQCIVPIAPPPSTGVCTKPVDSLSMEWKGTGKVQIVPYRGLVGSTALPKITDVDPGDIVTVTGLAGSPNDVEWAILDANGAQISKAQFHISCSDSEMDGPEDCGKLEGNGKRNDTGYPNSWLFQGMTGFACTPPNPPGPADACTITPSRTLSCDTEGKPTSLTFLYNPGGCDGNNPQSGKFTCSGTASGTVSVSSSNGYSIAPSTVAAGGTFTISASRFSAQSTFQVGGQTLSIHTSCSQLLEVGNVFGSLTLVGFNGKQGINEVKYLYTVTNTGANAENVSLVDDKLGMINGNFSLPSGGVLVFDKSTTLTQTTTNRATVQGASGGQMCTATDDVTVTVQPPVTPPCKHVDKKGKCKDKDKDKDKK